MKKINLILLSLFMMSGCSLEFHHLSSSELSSTITSSSSKEEITSSVTISSTENSSVSSSESTITSSSLESSSNTSSSESSSETSSSLSSSSSNSSSSNIISSSNNTSTSSSSSSTSISESSSSSSISEVSSSSSSTSSSTSSSEEIQYHGEYLKDTDFNDLSSWIIEPQNNTSKLEIVSNGSNSLELKVNNSKATNYYDIQVLQNNLELNKDTTYRVRFKIKSSTSRTFKFIIQKMDYSALAYEENISLTKNQVYEFDKDIVVKDSSTYLYGFMLGKVDSVSRSSHTITISNPSLTDELSEEDSFGGKKGTFAEAPATYKNRTLIWSDEFNGNELDDDNWSYNIGDGGWGNNEYQYYTNSTNNVRVANGSLRITARKEQYKNASYTSGRIDTKGKQSFKYGYFEARIALPSAMGIWPAFWMLGVNIDDINWPKCGEIDIMEAINNENKVYSTLHWNSNGVSGDTSHTYQGNEGYNISDREEYHLYAVEWKETGIKTYVDNVEVFSYSFYSTSVKEAFQKEFYFLLNVAVGGDWPGFEIDDNFPHTMSVDYLRVYQ